MKISVIIPVYNAEKFIRKAVESALMQEETAEVILIEDNSPDNTLAICQKLEQEYEKVVLLQHPDKGNHGAGASRNLGIKNAKYEYIAFLDADDYYLPNRFKKDKEVFAQYPDADGVYNALGQDLLDNEVKLLEAVPYELTTVTRILKPEDLFEHMGPIGHAGYFSGDALTVKKEIFKKVGFFEESLRISQDTHFFIKLSLKARLYPGNIEVAVGMRGVHINNRSRGGNKIPKSRPKVYGLLFKWAISNDIEKDKILTLWGNYYEWVSLLNPSVFNRIKILVLSFIQYPPLLSSKVFYRRVPFLCRFL